MNITSSDEQKRENCRLIYVYNETVYIKFKKSPIYILLQTINTNLSDQREDSIVVVFFLWYVNIFVGDWNNCI